MAYQLDKLTGPHGQPALSEQELRQSIERLRRVEGPRLRRLWAYYHNTMRVGGTAEPASDSDRPYRQAQEWGLPARITGVRASREVFAGVPVRTLRRKEVVIENDIGWRIEAMVDYLFGKPLVIRSAAPDEARRAQIDPLIAAILESNGGTLFLQRLALLGAVYGFVDVLVKLDPAPDDPATSPTAQDSPALSLDDPADPGARNTSHDAIIERIARRVRLEIVEPARALPVLSTADYRVVDAYVQCYEIARRSPAMRRPAILPPRWWERWLRSAEHWLAWTGGEESPVARDTVQVVEIIAPGRWQRYEDETLIAEGDNSLGQIPLVHIQNTSVPFEYAGTSEVETLIPLQDELNTRLSDRANRITLQSFRMYLGKGIDAFTDMPLAPGRIWLTDNPQAEIQEFGGDDDSPSESLHIADLREALDKTSGVSPIAAGAIKNRIGRLTSAAALRLTLISLLAKTDKKRTTYGLGIRRMLELALAWLDRAGLFATTPDERQVELHWPSPLPENDMEKLQEAQAKASLGVPREQVLRELGY